MTSSIGYDEYYETGHAIPPSLASQNLLSFVEGMTMAQHHGKFFAPGGPKLVFPFVRGFFEGADLMGG